MAARSAYKFGQNLKELRIHLCQKSAASKGVRDFIENHYVQLKKSNPQFPILIRESRDVNPVVWARYAYGKETNATLLNKSKDEVFDIVQSLAK
ncbi:DgyrCDS5168 [Dimorphilus gyrociliatus]|uniref:NADH dehydrogenase [ubiquinone] 1 alpha subcomplex subunit 2 n=1 Tax=Dimorphilus gyrociliatus TaxID=2664684 RepID=A0A7I8VJP0_9ANNE|nr:DgyrCDS5168 [Dimorphilus gyrociliatus]